MLNVLKLQIWKQKGEEYRIHGQWGWLWNSSTRKYKKHNLIVKPSLSNGPAKIAVRVREGNIIKVLAVEPKTYEYLTHDSENKEVIEKCKYYFYNKYNYMLIFVFIQTSMITTESFQCLHLCAI